MARKIFSSCLAIIFVPIFLVTIYLIGVKSSLFSPDFYLKIFNKSNFYSTITQSLALSLSKTYEQAQKEGSIFGPLSADDLADVLHQSIPQNWFDTNLKNVLVGFSNYANGKNQSIDVIIPLRDVKNSLAVNLSQKFNQRFSAMSECTSEQLERMQSENSNPMSWNCRPPSANIEEVEKAFKDGLTSGQESLLSIVPDQYNFADFVNKNPAILSGIRQFYNYSSIGLYILLTLSILLLFIIALINRRNISGALKWISIPLLIVGIFALLSTIFGNLTIKALIGGFTLNLPTEIRNIIFNLIGSAIQQFFNSYYLISGIVLLVSVIILIIAIVEAKKHPENREVEIDKRLQK